ncbi:MAG: putative D-alanyl-D-alanine carboxypeptidase [Actinomycetota bacterium]|jgi:D-alanyl-D-alanine carboxypeptidase/D-alanyl-D-alanine-endopeptidase (penicillin-binding protein 4)
MSRTFSRRARNPLPTLLFLISFPSVLLAGVWRFADSQDNSDPPPIDAIADLPETTPQTPLLSSRRSPLVLARESSSTAFEIGLRPLGGAVLPGSCAAISVDGILSLSDGIDTPVTPASTLKVIVAAVALEVLGPDTVFTTEVRADLSGGTAGTLYLVGGGDPMLAASWYPNDANLSRFPQQPATSLDLLADAVIQQGLQQVSGNVVGDSTRYDAELYPPNWPIQFRTIEGGPIGGLVVNDNAVLNQPTRALDPGIGAASEFARLLLERGVTISGAATSGQAPVGVATIARISSAPLVDIVGAMLGTSDNNTAEMLLKEIGFQARGQGSRAAGISVVEERLRAWGIPLTGWAMVDGSGLSRDNKVTCSSFLAVLERFRTGDQLVSRMPVAGVSGTLSTFFIGGPLEGRLFGKTGTLTGVKGLVGFVDTQSGSIMRIVVLLEGEGVSQEENFRPIWEKYLADAVGDFASGPSAEEIAPLAPLGTTAP